MKIIDRYIFRQFALLFVLMLFILSTLVAVVKFVDEIEYFSKNHTSVSVIVQYFIYFMPTTMDRIIALAVIISTLALLLLLNLHNELIAVQAGGISKSRVAGIVLFGSLLITGLLWINNESILPKAYQRSKNIQAEKIEKKPSLGFVAEKQTWLKGPGNEYYSIALVGPGALSLQDTYIYQLSNDGNRILAQTHIQTALWDSQKKQWSGKEVRERTFDTDLNLVKETFTPEKEYPIQFKPEDFIQVVQTPNQMNTKQLKEQIDLLKLGNMDTKETAIYYYGRYASILCPVIMALIGLCYGFYISRMQIASGFATAILWALVYLMLNQFSITIGKTGILPPLACAWLGNLIVGGWGLFKLRKVLW